ncbi:MAG: hypothetical protein RLZZ53_1352, partial [Acidobacteriota bacterium]
MSLNKVLRKLSMLSLLVAGVVVGVVLSGRVTEQPDVMARTAPTSATASAAT